MRCSEIDVLMTGEHHTAAAAQLRLQMPFHQFGCLEIERGERLIEDPQRLGGGEREAGEPYAALLPLRECTGHQGKAYAQAELGERRSSPICIGIDSSLGTG